MNDEEMRQGVQKLLDRQEILDCVMRYSRGVDRADRNLIMSVFHEDAVDDHGMIAGNREEFADWALGMHARAHYSHQHCIFNHLCELEGDVAHTETYYMFACMNRSGEPFSVGGGRYLDRFERRNGKWAIAARVCVRDWAPLAEQPGVADPRRLTAVFNVLTPEQQEFMLGGPPSTRDRSDISYERPLTIDPDRIRNGHRLHEHG
jgi:hypothetical protein